MSVLQCPLDGNRLCLKFSNQWYMNQKQERAHHVTLVSLHCPVGVNAAEGFMSVDVAR